MKQKQAKNNGKANKSKVFEVVCFIFFPVAKLPEHLQSPASSAQCRQRTVGHHHVVAEAAEGAEVEGGTPHGDLPEDIRLILLFFFRWFSLAYNV